MRGFEFHTTRSIIVQRGAAHRLGERVRVMGARSALIVTDPGVMGAGLLNDVLAGFAGSGVAVSTFSQVEADPPAEVIHAAVDRAVRVDADCVVGFGGGSSMDVAKLVAVLACGREKLSDIYGVDRVSGPRLSLILVPTTAGTGSEVTPISIVTTGDGEKKGVVSPVILPDLALLDAELTVGLPAHVTAATGIDAMVHSIEAYTSARFKNPLSDCLARDALRLLSKNIHAACINVTDLEARENMLLGACLAGMAFANAPVGGVHALAYPLGARFKVPHGLSNSLMLGAVMRFNLEKAQPLYAQIAEIVLPPRQASPADRARELIAFLDALPAQLELPCRLRAVGVQASDIGALAADAMKQTRLLVNNPREITPVDAVALYAEVL
jgi:alcohol dehydrogenase class IV